MEIKYWIFFCLFKVYLISFIFELINYLKTTNLEKFECMEYISDETIFITKNEKLHIYFKVKVVGEIFC